MGKKKRRLENKAAGSLPMMALDQAPSPKADAKRIVALSKKEGRVVGYQLSDGSVLTREEGVSLAKKGGITGVGIAHNGDTEYLKSLPDETEENNLSSLPAVQREDS